MAIRPKPFGVAQRDAAAEMAERGRTCGLQVGGVGEAADGARLPLGVARAQRPSERRVVLGAALGEVGRARNRGCRGSNGFRRGCGRRRLPCANGSASASAASASSTPAIRRLRGGDADQRGAALGVVLGGGERAAIGVERLAPLPGLAPQLALERGEVVAVAGAARQGKAALDERQRALLVIGPRLVDGRLEIGARRRLVLGAIEMLGAQREIAPAIPLGGGAVELGAAASGSARSRRRRG